MIPGLAARLRASPGLTAKADIAAVATRLGLSGTGSVPVGDDCAAIPDGAGGYVLLAIEGFIHGFVAGEPWFAGWCGIMVNLSDIAAMGGRPIAVVDALWASGEAGATPILEGLRAASAAYGVPVVGGHTNLHADRGQLAVAVLGRATRLLTSFDARPGDSLIAAIDLRGRYRPVFSNWDAATDAPPARLRDDLALLPDLAEAGLVHAAKDISQAGVVGTAVMLAEASGVGLTVDPAAVPRPEGVDLERWLQSFPSFGFLLAVPPDAAATVISVFTGRAIAAAAIGTVTADRQVVLVQDGNGETVWDLTGQPLIGCGPA